MSRRNPFVPKPNYNWSVFSVSVVLFFLALVALLSVHSSALVNHYKEQLTILVEIEHERPSDLQRRLHTYLQSQDAVIEESIEFISKEEAYTSLQEQMNLASESDLPNPLLDAFHFNVAATYVKADILTDLAGKIEAFDQAVSGVHYQDVMFDTLFRHLDKLVLGILVAAILILPIALFLIFGAVRLALYDQRFVIRNMELLGASWSFIRRPFISKGFKLGIVSGFTGLLPLICLISMLMYKFPGLIRFLDWPKTGGILLSTFLLSVCLYVCCSFNSVNRYLRLETIR